jgi:hypothetical protein
MSKNQEFEKDDQVQILVGGPHENYGRLATVSRIQDDGDVVIYFGDQDEDEWVYSPNELTKVSTNPEIGALDRVRVLAEKWENAIELGTGHPSIPSIVARAFVEELRKALEGK